MTVTAEPEQAVVFRLLAPGNTTFYEGQSAATADRLALAAWDDFRLGQRSGKHLPRVLVEIGLDGHQSIVKTYPKEN